MGMVGILVGSGWLLRELGMLLGSEPQEKPRRCTQRRGQKQLIRRQSVSAGGVAPVQSSAMAAISDGSVVGRGTDRVHPLAAALGTHLVP